MLCCSSCKNFGCERQIDGDGCCHGCEYFGYNRLYCICKKTGFKHYYLSEVKPLPKFISHNVIFKVIDSAGCAVDVEERDIVLRVLLHAKKCDGCMGHINRQGFKSVDDLQFSLEIQWAEHDFLQQKSEKT